MKPGRLRSDPLFRGSLSESDQPVKGQGGQGRGSVARGWMMGFDW